MAAFDYESTGTEGKLGGSFNPNIPNLPLGDQWIHLAKPAGAIEANKSTGVALSGIGHTLDIAAKGLDFAVKKGAEDQIHAAVDDLQHKRIAELQSHLIDIQRPVGGPAPFDRGQGEQGAPIDILPTKAAVPGELEGLRQTVGTLAAAKEKGLPKTYYEARLDALASDFRSRYPGYRDYIDKVFAESTGAHQTANQYINSLTSTIDSFVQQQNAAQNKVVSYLEAHGRGIPGIDAQMFLAQRNQLTMSQAVQFTYPYEHVKAEHELWLAQEGTDKIKTGTQFRSWVGERSTAIMNTIIPTIGKSPAEISDMIARGDSISEETADRMKSALMSAYQNELMYFRSLASLAKSSDGKTTIYGVMGPDLDKDLEFGLKGIKELADHVGNKEWGPGAALARLASIRQTAVKLGVMTNSEWSGAIAMDKAIKDLNDPVLTNMFHNWLLAPDAAPDWFKAWADFAKKSMVIKGKPVAEVISEGEAKTTGPNGKPDPTINFSSVLDVIDLVKGAKDDATKSSIFQSFFDERNLGLLDKFDKDRYETGPDGKSRLVKGKYYAFNKILGDTDTIKEAVRLGFGDKVKTWAGSEFGKLLQTDLMQLKDMPLGWDPKNLQFILNPNQQSSAFARNMWRGTDTTQRQAFLNINKALQSLKNVTDATNADGNQEIMQLLLDMGYDPKVTSGEIEAKKAEGQVKGIGSAITEPVVGAAKVIGSIPGTIESGWERRSQDPLWPAVQTIGDLIKNAVLGAVNAIPAEGPKSGRR